LFERFTVLLRVLGDGVRDRSGGGAMSEHGEQATFVEYVLYRYRNDPTFIRPVFFSVPNGAWLGGRNPYALMNKYRAEGFTKGVADILYLQPREPYHCLALEMKSAAGKATADQLEFILAVEKAGGMARICHGANQAIETFDFYMCLEPK
jgi:hypothetical protein